MNHQLELEYDDLTPVMTEKRTTKRFTRQEDNLIIQLINVEGMDYSQVAAELGRSYGSISGRVRRLREEGVEIEPGIHKNLVITQAPVKSEQPMSLSSKFALVIAGIALFVGFYYGLPQ